MQSHMGTATKQVRLRCDPPGQLVPKPDANSIVQPSGSLPADVRGLVLAVKAYERAAIQAAIHDSELMARKAMLLYPAIGEWKPSKALYESLIVHC
jgi:alpha-galactosidase/6-phospho-beta-glucosidase family protein